MLGFFPYENWDDIFHIRIRAHDVRASWVPFALGSGPSEVAMPRGWAEEDEGGGTWAGVSSAAGGLSW